MTETIYYWVYVKLWTKKRSELKKEPHERAAKKVAATTTANTPGKSVIGTKITTILIIVNNRAAKKNEWVTCKAKEFNSRWYTHTCGKKLDGDDERVCIGCVGVHGGWWHGLVWHKTK